MSARRRACTGELSTLGLCRRAVGMTDVGRAMPKRSSTCLCSCSRIRDSVCSSRSQRRCSGSNEAASRCCTSSAEARGCAAETRGLHGGMGNSTWRMPHPRHLAAAATLPSHCGGCQPCSRPSADVAAPTASPASRRAPTYRASTCSPPTRRLITSKTRACLCRSTARQLRGEGSSPGPGLAE